MLVNGFDYTIFINLLYSPNVDDGFVQFILIDIAQKEFLASYYKLRRVVGIEI